MMNRRNLLALSLGAVASAVLTGPAWAASWVLLGSRTVNLLADHDTIRVGLGKGLFTHIRLHVSGNTVFIHQLHVTFSNGTSEDIPVRLLFLPGTYSRDIRLPGILRSIRRIDLTYSKLLGGGKAVVTVQGRKL